MVFNVFASFCEKNLGYGNKQPKYGCCFNQFSISDKLISSGLIAGLFTLFIETVAKPLFIDTEKQ